MNRRKPASMRSERWKAAGVGLLVLAGLAVVGTMDYADEQKVARLVFNRCVVSMGAITDLEIVTAMIECSERTGYEIQEEDWP